MTCLHIGQVVNAVIDPKGCSLPNNRTDVTICPSNLSTRIVHIFRLDTKDVVGLDVVYRFRVVSSTSFKPIIHVEFCGATLNFGELNTCNNQAVDKLIKNLLSRPLLSHH
jgi:hypothetical protein